ncbi:MAG TPA: hypothetical protein VJY33_18420 [Isosphaeraceae bacterium]|nr:hypothetical protein [Isosphaeraceae bacterium]
MIKRLARRLRRVLDPAPLAPAAAAERGRDRAGLPDPDPGIERAVDEAVAWLGRAQDHSRTQDGGVARHYSLLDGWGGSYPETTGYIVPTLLDIARIRGGPIAEEARRRARRMLDWLVSIQFPEGGFQGGMIDQEPVVPVTFNTGQILLGLAAGVEEFGEAYIEPMRRAADWLVTTQDPDGCWRKYPTPFAAPGEKAYETHVAWGLLEAARAEGSAGGTRYADSALANVSWALNHQAANGWFAKCCLEDEDQPLSHTLGYLLRGLVEAYLFAKDPALLKAAMKTADGLLSAIRADGYLPGRIGRNWRGTVRWSCLTGSAQVAGCWLLLHEQTGRPSYRDAARAANQYVRRTIKVEGPPETRGAVKGSFPIDGGYCTFLYPNWACKFFVDSNLLERRILSEGEAH